MDNKFENAEEIKRNLIDIETEISSINNKNSELRELSKFTKEEIQALEKELCKLQREEDNQNESSNFDFEDLELKLEEEKIRNEELKLKIQLVLEESKRTEKVLEEQFSELEIQRNKNSIFEQKVKEMEEEYLLLKEQAELIENKWENELLEPNLNGNLFSEINGFNINSQREVHEQELQSESICLNSKRKRSLSSSRFQSIAYDDEEENIIVGEESMNKKSFKKIVQHTQTSIIPKNKKDSLLNQKPVEFEDYMSRNTNNIDNQSPSKLDIEFNSEVKEDIEKVLQDFRKKKMAINQTSKIGFASKNKLRKK